MCPVNTGFGMVHLESRNILFMSLPGACSIDRLPMKQCGRRIPTERSHRSSSLPAFQP